MRQRILDTSFLISFWNRRGGQPDDVEQARAWGYELVELERTNSIVSPVYLEFVCGARSQKDLIAAEAFLSSFDIRDGWDVRSADLNEARRIARRVPRDGRPRQLGDCLIKAIANRLRCEVVTRDERFPRG
jgi:predicted nucleic acid-binding protein